MTNWVRLWSKTSSYLINYGSEGKKNCLEATQLENKINHLEKNKISTNSIKKIKKNSWKTINYYKEYKDKKHNAFTEELNKIALSSNADTRMQPVDSTETYAYGRSKDLVSEKEAIKWD